MSFSSDVKEELSELNNLANKEIIRIELIGYLISSNVSFIGRNKIKFSTESEYNINRFAKLLNNMNILEYNIELQGKTYVIIFDKAKVKDFVEINNGNIFVENIDVKEENVKAILRGLFLGSGSINNPENNYHLEVKFSNEENMKYIYMLLSKTGFNVKLLDNNNEYTIYAKEGEEISRILASIGASKGILKFEEIRVQRDMNNKVNRLVNCETANLNKTINAAVSQIEAIEYLQKTKQLEKLEEPLKEIAKLRLENPNASLVELGQLLEIPIGKSGVNYRLKRLIDIANLK